jgi:hypothetical protein
VHRSTDARDRTAGACWSNASSVAMSAKRGNIPSQYFLTGSWKASTNHMVRSHPETTSEKEKTMIPRLKILAPALAAVLVIAAVASSSAQAAPTFTCSPAPCKATGSNKAGSEIWTTAGGTIQCDNHYTIEQVGGGSIPSGGSNQVTVTPSFQNCVAFGFPSGAVFHENGCDYVFTSTELVSPGAVYWHHVKLECPGTGGGMTLTAGPCTVDIPEAGNENWTRVRTTNLPNGTVTVQPEISFITLNVTTDDFGCPFSGTGHTTANYHGDVVISRIGAGSVSTSGA